MTQRPVLKLAMLTMTAVPRPDTHLLKIVAKSFPSLVNFHLSAVENLIIEYCPNCFIDTFASSRLRGGYRWSFSRTFEQAQLPLSLRHSRPRHPRILFSKWNCREQCFISNATRFSTRGNKTAKLVPTWKSHNGETFGIIVAGITIHSSSLAELALLHKVD